MSKQFIQFLMISLIGLSLNSGILYYFHQKWKVNFYSSKFLAIAFVFAWNFTANYLFTFKNG